VEAPPLVGHQFQMGLNDYGIKVLNTAIILQEEKTFMPQIFTKNLAVLFVQIGYFYTTGDVMQQTTSR
jgi:hypothetical protein